MPQNVELLPQILRPFFLQEEREFLPFQTDDLNLYNNYTNSYWRQEDILDELSD